MTPVKQDMARQGPVKMDHHDLNLLKARDLDQHDSYHHQHQQEHYHHPYKMHDNDYPVVNSISSQQQQQQQQPISMSLSPFNADGSASIVFCLQGENAAQNALAPWNSIYVPKQYRLPTQGQRQSSPGECDLVLKVFPRLVLPGIDGEPYRTQELQSTPCEKCKVKKRDVFQIGGYDPAVPSPQRIFFSTGEIRLMFLVCCLPWHHTDDVAEAGYAITFELHHGKHVLLSETYRNAGPGLVPEHIPNDILKTVPLLPAMPKVTKRKPSPLASQNSGGQDFDNDHTLPRKRSVMSLNSIVSTNGQSRDEPFSPSAAVVPHSPPSYQQEMEDANVSRSQSKSLSNDDGAESSNKSSRSGSAKAEDPPNAQPNVNMKVTRKRQEPLELSELGIGQRASANLHAAYVNGQLKERVREGLAVPEQDAPKKATTKPKPQHSCPEPDCDKSFSRLFNLRSHMRTHSKARPFVCEDCNFAFSRRHDRDRHAKKHLSEKPYKCIVCDATFVRQDALVRHLRMDGVQNMCMAAMEQRSMQLGDGEDDYMMAAKQQAHDEQQLQDQRDADELSRQNKSLPQSHNRQSLQQSQQSQQSQQQSKLQVKQQVQPKQHSKQLQQLQQQQEQANGMADMQMHNGSDSRERSPKPEFIEVRPNLDANLDANLLLKSMEASSLTMSTDSTSTETAVIGREEPLSREFQDQELENAQVHSSSSRRSSSPRTESYGHDGIHRSMGDDGPKLPGYGPPAPVSSRHSRYERPPLAPPPPPPRTSSTPSSSQRQHHGPPHGSEHYGEGRYESGGHPQANAYYAHPPRSHTHTRNHSYGPSAQYSYSSHAPSSSSSPSNGSYPYPSDLPALSPYDGRYGHDQGSSRRVRVMKMHPSTCIHPQRRHHHRRRRLLHTAWV
ncbi:hypothetical protein BGZ94_008110 [Podila epigama]|nr:hypothetical protein BGZ94_008110 [Podila epigama]